MRRHPALSAGLVAVMCAALGLTASSAVPAGAARTAAGGRWATMMDEAFTAISNAEAVGTVTQAGTLSSTSSVTVTDSNGDPVEVQQRSVLATDDSGLLLVGMDLLGDSQLVVDAIDPSTGDGTTLVLNPGSDTVHSQSALLPQRGHGAERAAVAGGCYASPDAPLVIGSVFGPLVKGTGVISCPYANENLALIASLYTSSSGGAYAVGKGGSTSTYGTYLSEDAYFGCSPSAGHGFETAQLWSVNGGLQPGATSPWSSLGCAQ